MLVLNIGCSGKIYAKVTLFLLKTVYCGYFLFFAGNLDHPPILTIFRGSSLHRLTGLMFPMFVSVCVCANRCINSYADAGYYQQYP